MERQQPCWVGRKHSIQRVHESSNPGPGRRAAVISRVVKVQGRKRRGRGKGGVRRKKKNPGEGNDGGEGRGRLAVTEAGGYTEQGGTQGGSG